VFYGCNNVSFPQRFLAQRSDLRFAASYGVASYPSYSNKYYVRVDDYERVKEHYEIYYWGRGKWNEPQEGLTLFAREFVGEDIFRFGDKPYHWDVSPRPLDPRFFPNMTYERAMSVFSEERGIPFNP
jgi:hypothetical protein